jgi:segregation and condensation protein B
MASTSGWVTGREVAASIERHLGNPRPLPLSRAATEVLAIVAYRQPIARAGVEFIRGSASDSALETLVQRGLVEHTQHHLLLTTRAFLELAGLREDPSLPAFIQRSSSLNPKLRLPLINTTNAYASTCSPSLGPRNRRMNNAVVDHSS